MENKEIIFEKEKMAAYMKISEQVFTDIKLQVGQEGMDYYQNLLTCELTGYIYSNLAEERELKYFAPRPTFLDWLLKRRKVVKFNLKVKDLLLNPPKLENTQRIYIVENGN